MGKSRRERRSEQRNLNKGNITDNDFTYGSQHLINKLLRQGRMNIAGSDANYNYFISFMNNHQIRFIENKKTGDFGPEVTTGLAKSMGYDSVQDFLASDHLLDFFNERINAGKKFPLVKKT